MTIAVDLGRKATKQTNKQTNITLLQIWWTGHMINPGRLTVRNQSLETQRRWKGPRQVCKTRTLTLNAPIATKVVCFSRLLKCLRSIYDKQCEPRSDCSYRSRLFWVHTVCFYTSSSVMLGNYLQQMTSADDIFRCIFFLAL